MEMPKFVIARKRPDAPSGHVYFTGKTEAVECDDGSVANAAKTTFFASEAISFADYETAADWVAQLQLGTLAFFVGVTVPGSDDTVLPVVIVPEGWGAELAETADA